MTISGFLVSTYRAYLFINLSSAHLYHLCACAFEIYLYNLLNL